MTDTDLSTPPTSPDAAPRKRAGLTGMVLADLRTLAEQVGVGATAGMRKGDLIAAIKERQGGPAPVSTDPATTTPAPVRARTARPAVTADVVPAAPAHSSPPPEASPAPETPAPETPAPQAADPGTAPRRTRQRRAATRPTGAPESVPPEPQVTRAGAATEAQQGSTSRLPVAAAAEHDGVPPQRDQVTEDDARGGADDRGERTGRRERQTRRDRGDQSAGTTRNGSAQNGSAQNGSAQNGSAQNGQAVQDADTPDLTTPDLTTQDDGGPQGGRSYGTDDEGDGRGRRGGRRFRERRRGRDRDGVPSTGNGNGAGQGGGGVQVREDRELEVRDDDVLQPVAGILDVLDQYAFVRTSGYLAGSNDVYVAMNMVRKNGLRRGDAITGAVRIPREGEAPTNRQKFNPLVRIDTINGGDAEAARKRPEFGKLTPLYPNQRLRLETTPNILTTRVIDLVMPIGKGQRALIVSPPKAGKTSVLQAIANAIAVNNPECHLMVVLVDERPEEVTDMQRSVKGEVIASTFDRPPGDHTAVAELAIERAKRLVEGGMDVVVLLDSITRLGRAYNNSSPASGRILSGGVDSTALYPPKRFLGAARNIENGGSLTIIATAMVETGSTGDTVIFEEFKGTGNAELKLDRKIAERRVFPAVDVNPSGTRKDELLMTPEEYAVALKLRRVLSGLDSHQAIDLLIDRLRKSSSNAEFMVQVAKTASSGPAGADES